MKHFIIVSLLISYFLIANQSYGQYIYILGTTQDGGYPHAGCEKQCCAKARKDCLLRKYVVSFALADSTTKQWWLFEATPDINEQLHDFNLYTRNQYKYLPDGIFITHAHIGHYAGLMQLGREVMNTKDVAVYVMSKMKEYLETNGPWSQLVKLHNITVTAIHEGIPFQVNKNISIIPFTVPHRDEYSETAGFQILTPYKKYLFIPDIDKWGKWNKNIVDEVKAVDIALLDATFYSNTELPNRPISEVPHPLASETMELFSNTAPDVRSKIHFIHFNHTNPLLWNDSTITQLKNDHYNTCKQGDTL